MTRILVVEDDPEIAEFIRLGLQVEGYEPEVARSQAELRARLLDTGECRLIVLDWMLPDGEGVDICRELRERWPRILILMLTARDTLDHKIEGLRAGADDYMTKPFAFTELILRIEALLRRTQAQPVPELRVGDLVLDPALKSATRGGRDLGLSPTEFALLRFLVENRGHILSRMELLSGVWGKDYDPNTNIVEVYIAYLRRKLGTDDGPGLIRNVRGFGYTIADP